MSKIECDRSNLKFSPRSGARVVAQQQHIIDRETRLKTEQGASSSWLVIIINNPLLLLDSSKCIFVVRSRIQYPLVICEMGLLMREHIQNMSMKSYLSGLAPREYSWWSSMIVLLLRHEKSRSQQQRIKASWMEIIKMRAHSLSSI